MKTFALAAVIAASLSAAPAFAQNAAQIRIVITPAGLDLTTAQGRAALDLRVLHAARTACGTPSSTDARGRNKADACIEEVRLAAAARQAEMIASAEREARTRLASR